jgi:hypothetical protein
MFELEKQLGCCTTVLSSDGGNVSAPGQWCSKAADLPVMGPSTTRQPVMGASTTLAQLHHQLFNQSSSHMNCFNA